MCQTCDIIDYLPFSQLLFQLGHQQWILYLVDMFYNYDSHFKSLGILQSLEAKRQDFSQCICARVGLAWSFLCAGGHHSVQLFQSGRVYPGGYACCVFSWLCQIYLVSLAIMVKFLPMLKYSWQ